MRLVLVTLTIGFALVIGNKAIQSMSTIQEQRNAQYCQIDPSFCSTN